MRDTAAEQRYCADFSLALINRTGAYHACRDILSALPQFFVSTRYWRFAAKQEPRGLVRRLCARAMLFELGRAKSLSIPRVPSKHAAVPTLFMDPLYVLGGRLKRADIVLCHDVGPHTAPHLFDARGARVYEAAYRQIAAVKPGMVFVSEASQAAFHALFGNDLRFSTVIPLYVRTGSELGDDRPPAGIREPFLLTVGALELRKNHARVIEAFTRSGLRERGFSYVFCGPRGNDAARVEALARSTPGVHNLGFVTDAEMRWLYRHATGFVLPSLLEGFGLPALEAAKHGLLALVGDTGAQREAVGEGAILVDPTSVDAIADGLRRLVDMPQAERSRLLSTAGRHASALSHELYVARWSSLLAEAQAFA